ncbi:deoxyribodipyrimidine photo-lyase [Halolactibacillus miurensis]|uniref:Deoxyribodipyrimidine photo-lyase n=1 Tax=Halolactibacillus miurensis TaxID=306541 RepID=A0A1I6V3T0_9BACI|nr:MULTISPECIES: deoxyribodipyrimidine photo-lyase [Halolactibacillus]GEM05808.1 deoxyribodipyrimidine photo-lyase [Halolactibacillus miurensis]SFT08217.1 deoxyribodipyrimidine photo-lyase [Halolactibacillus miurensis]
MRILVLFRRDLRLLDHPALAEAARDGEIVCGYIKKESLTSAHDYWTMAHVADIKQALNREDVPFLLGEGSVVEQVNAWCDRYDIDAVYFNRSYLHDEIEREDDLIDSLENKGIKTKRFVGDVLAKPGSVLTGKGEYYKVFTPFYKALRQKPLIEPVKKPTTFSGLSIESDDIAFKEPAWFKKLLNHYTPGEHVAIEQLNTFLEQALSRYSEGRDRPARKDTSHLSVYLSVGAISPRVIYQAVMAYDEVGPRVDKEKEAFIRQLMWRDFSYQQLYQHKEAETKAMREEFDRFNWENNQAEIERWKKGQTGYPLVDAGMRELYETGYMHNRVRMVVASFLVKHLLVDWRVGLDYFEHTLLDHDRQNNALGWQWVMGSGFDASPYFRIFNPITQAEKFDPDGDYIKRFVPELRQLSGQALFRPFEADEAELKRFGVVLGEDYPHPIVDHKSARERALSRYQEIKEASS